MEAVLNDRPITFVSSDVSDPVPLTPVHVLYGRQMLTYTKCINQTVSDPTAGNRSSIARRSRVQKQLIDHFRENGDTTTLRPYSSTTE